MDLEGARVLIVEDEVSILLPLQAALRVNGVHAHAAGSIAEAQQLLATAAFDALIIDLNLPDGDGGSLVREARGAADTPIIVLSARGREQDRVDALDAGADDFVGKPYSMPELLARLRAALRRSSLNRHEETLLRVPGLEVDLRSRRVSIEGEDIRLSGREHALLCLLVRKVGQVVTHREIVEAVWGENSAADAQFVRVLVGQLRQKIEAEPSRPQLLKTEPGLGYRLDLSPL